MRLAEATKEELIWWITKKVGEDNIREDEFSLDVYYKRLDEIDDDMTSCADQFSKLYEEYNHIVGRYSKLSDFSNKDLKRAVSLEREMNGLKTRWCKLLKKTKALRRSIDEILRKRVAA